MQGPDDYKINWLRASVTNNNLHSSPDLISNPFIQNARLSNKTSPRAADNFGFLQMDNSSNRSRSPEYENDRVNSLFTAWKILDDCVEYTSDNEQFYK